MSSSKVPKPSSISSVPDGLTGENAGDSMEKIVVNNQQSPNILSLHTHAYQLLHLVISQFPKIRTVDSTILATNFLQSDFPISGHRILKTKFNTLICANIREKVLKLFHLLKILRDIHLTIPFAIEDLRSYRVLAALRLFAYQ